MTKKTATQLTAEINALFANNTAGQITPTSLRTVTQDLVDSSVGSNLTDLTSPDSSITVTTVDSSTKGVALPASGVTAGTYGDGSNIPQITVNNKGLATGLTTVPLSVSVNNLTDSNIAAAAGIKATKLALDTSGTGGTTRTIAQILADYENSVSRYGAALNGTTDDTTAFTNAINALQGKEIFIPPAGNAKITGALPALTSGTSIGGHSKSAKGRITTSGNFNLFTLNGSDVEIKNLYIDDALKTGGVDVLLSCTGGSTQPERIFLTDIYTTQSRGFFADTGSGGSAFYRSFWALRCQNNQHKGVGWSITRAFAFTYLDHCTVDFGGTTTNSAGFSMDFSSSGVTGGAAGGLVYTTCNVLGSGGGNAAGLSSQHGFLGATCTEIRFFDCDADSVCGDGFNFNNSGGLYFTTAVASLVNGYCYRLTNSTKVHMVNSVARGRNNQTTNDGTASRHGLSLVNTTNGRVNGCQFEACTGDGINIDSSTNFVLSGNMSLANTGRGLVGTTTGAFNFTGGVLSANTAGNYSLNNSTQTMETTMASSGGIISAVTGPASG